MFTSSNHSTSDGGDDHEDVFNALYYKKKAEEVIRQLKRDQSHDYRCTCKECVKGVKDNQLRMHKKLYSWSSKRLNVKTTRNTVN